MLLSRYERMIARRYLLPGRGEAFIALVAGISLVAVMLGVAALVVVMSVMNGFRAELFDKIVGLNGHAVVQGYGGQLRDWREIAAAAKKTPGVVSATPLIENPLMASYNGRVAGVLVRGMRVPDIRDNKTLNGKVVVGSLNTLTPGSGTVAIGSRLAESLGAIEGSDIQLISPEGPASPFGTVPRIVSYKVGAIFEVGVFDYDKAFIVMPIEDAQTLLLMGDSVGMIEMDVTDPDKVGEIVAPLVDVVARRGQIVDWRQMNAQLFEALAVDRLVTFTVLSILIMVSTFNILSSLIMLVRAKTRDIAILRTMGASRASDDADLHDRRHGDRCGRHRIRADPGVRAGLFPAGCRHRPGCDHRPANLGSVDAVPDRTARQDRSAGSDRRGGDGIRLLVPRDALPCVQGGEYRSGSGA